MKICRGPRLFLFPLLALGLPAVPAHSEVVKEPCLVDMTRDSTRLRLESDVLLPTEVRFWPEANPASVRVVLAHPESLDAKVRVVSAESPRKVLERDEAHFLYDAVILGLASGTAYGYEVFQGGVAWGGGRFRTFEEKADRVRFIATGDVRTGHQFHLQLARQYKAHRPDFVTIAGDLALDGRVYSEWQWYFEIGNEFFGEIPLFPAWGNHDGRASYFERYFPFSRRSHTRSFNCGPVHVVLVDSGNDEEAGELQWIDQDLAAARDMPWKIAVYHHPTFNEGGHGSAFGLTKLLPLFKRHKLDLTITGHSHLYERSYPLKSVLKDEQAIVHVITGGGGAPLANDQDAFYLAAHAKKYHFLLVEASAVELTGTAIGLDGQPFDRFTIRNASAVAAREGGAELPTGEPGERPVDSPPPAAEAAGKVVAEEAVALWRALRLSFEARARFRVPEVKEGKAAEPLPAAIPWMFKAPASPLPRRLPLQISLSPADRDLWILTPEVARFDWGPEELVRLFSIRPRTAEALTRQIPPQLEVRVENILVGFVQKAALKMTFAKDGKTTRRERL